MSEISDLMNHPEPSDNERASGMRHLLHQLNSTIKMAKEAGLNVEFINCSATGLPSQIRIFREL
jgi:hypothetical protein